MDHGLRLNMPEEFLQQIGIPNVALHQIEGIMGQGLGNVRPLGIGGIKVVDVVQARHAVPIGQQTIDHMGTDESRRAGHDHVHSNHVLNCDRPARNALLRVALVPKTPACAVFSRGFARRSLSVRPIILTT